MKDLDLIRKRKIWFLISLFFLIPSILSLIFWGLKPGVDFTGGTLFELKFQLEIDKPEIVRTIEEKDGEVLSIQGSGEKTFLIRLKEISKEKNEEIKNVLKEKYGETEELRFETLGPAIGREFLRKTLVAVFLASIGILLYIAWTFKDVKGSVSSWGFGLCAILALLHDTVILLGAFSVLGYFLGVEADLLLVTAVLTTMSFSVHDTIVVCDRIRENLKKYSGEQFATVVNRSVLETLIRSLNNSFTIIFMLTALLVLGGATIYWFIFALLIGTISGTYSSTFTAAPLLVEWNKWVGKRHGKKMGIKK